MNKLISNEDALNLRLLADAKYRLLDPGIKSTADRRKALGDGTNSTKEIMDILQTYMSELVSSIDREIQSIAENTQLIQVASNVRGTQTILAASWFAYVPNPENYDTASKLWSYHGLNPKAKKPRHSPFARKRLYELISKILIENQPYHQIYSRYKHKYTVEGLDEGHVHLASLRATSKLWLVHVHEVSRILADKSTNYNKSIETWGEDAIHEKEKFGWKIE